MLGVYEGALGEAFGSRITRFGHGRLWMVKTQEELAMSVQWQPGCPRVVGQWTAAGTSKVRGLGTKTATPSFLFGTLPCRSPILRGFIPPPQGQREHPHIQSNVVKRGWKNKTENQFAYPSSPFPDVADFNLKLIKVNHLPQEFCLFCFAWRTLLPVPGSSSRKATFRHSP